MTWRQLLARRPQWWVDWAARIRLAVGDSDETDAPEPTHHGRTSAEQKHFWTEFRDGQREADRRALEHHRRTRAPRGEEPT